MRLPAWCRALSRDAVAGAARGSLLSRHLDDDGNPKPGVKPIVVRYVNEKQQQPMHRLAAIKLPYGSKEPADTRKIENFKLAFARLLKLQNDQCKACLLYTSPSPRDS